MNALALMTGVDIPLPELELIMHQPTIKEISFLESELSYFLTLQLIGFDKRILLASQETSEEDKSRLSLMSDFDIFMMLLTDPKAGRSSERQKNFLNILILLFPGYEPQILPHSIYLSNSTTKHKTVIDANNFLVFKEAVVAVGGLKRNGAGENGSYNPKGKLAAEIAAKLMKGRSLVAAQKNESSGGVLARYISVLTIGLHSMSLNECVNLTVYQLYDLVERYGLFTNWDLDIRSRLAGASPDDKPEDWMKDIH